MRSRPSRVHLALAVLLLLIMAALRLHSLTLQEPFIDEGAHVQRARVVWAFDENPGRFANGKLLLYFWLGVFQLPPIEALWIARTAIALPSLLTGATVCAIGRRLGGPGAGLVALALYTVLPLSFFFERIALADPFAALFMALTVWRSMALARRPDTRGAVTVGLLAAAATLAKLTMGLVPLLPVVVTRLYGTAENWQEWRRRYGRGVILVVLVVAACWLPLLVPAAVAELEGEPFTLVNDANLAELGAPAPLVELRDIAPEVARYTSAPLLLAAVVGLGWLGWRSRKDRGSRAHVLFLLIWLLLLTVLPLLASRDVRTRYFMPLAAPLSVLLGWAAAEVWRTRRLAARLALTAAAAAWLGAFAVPFAVTTLTTPEDLSLPPHDAAVYLGGNFAGDAFRQAAALLDTVEPRPDQVVAERATCDMLYFFTARPIVCAESFTRPVELLNAPVSYVVLNGHEPQPDRLGLVWELIAEVERPALRELAGIDRTVQIWRARVPEGP